MWGGVSSEAASQASLKAFSLSDFFKPFQLPISKVSSSDLLKALGKFLPARHYQRGVTQKDVTQKDVTSHAVSGFTYHIGDFAQGGVIIWLTDDGLHGLVAAIEDANVGATTTFKWGSGTTCTSHNATNYDSLPFSTPNGPYGQYYGGYKNQQIIQTTYNLNDYPAFNAAAQYTKTVNGVTYNDWWLPSSSELKLMYAYKDVINQISINNGGSALLSDPITAPYSMYWSCCQDDADLAWDLIFISGYQGNDDKSFECAVRCVRAF